MSSAKPNTESKPWDALKGEGVKPFAAFQAYLSMGSTRSTRAVAQKLGKSDTLIGRWSKQYEWVARTLAWERHLAGEANTAEVDTVVAMRSRHARVARALLGKAVERLKTIKTEELTARELAIFIDVSTKLERLSMGQPTEIPGAPKEAAAGDLAGVGTADLLAIEKILSKSKG